MMYLVSDRDYDELRRLKKKVDGFRGDGVTNTPSAITIAQNKQKGSSTPSDAITGQFRVKVTKDGGSDGNSSTAASWTYTVKDLAGTTLAATVALARNRPKGKMTFPSADSDGWAYYDGSTLKLWDANEVPTKGPCT